MKKKGFVFIETIIVIVVLTVGMIMIYSSFSSILNSSKRRTTYDDIAYIYRSYYIQDFISSLNIEKFVDNTVGKNYLMVPFPLDCGKGDADSVLFKVDNNIIDGSVSDFPISQDVKELLCSQMMENFNVSKIYLTKYNINNIKNCTTSGGRASNSSTCDDATKKAISGLDTGTVHYLRTLKGTDADSFRLIISYFDRQIEPNNKVTKTKTTTGFRCPDGYFGRDEDDDEMCYRILNRTFYSNIKMIAKSKL